MSTPSPWPHFSMEELTCPCGCGQMLMDNEHMERMVQLRELLGEPIYISSGFRCENHDRQIGTSANPGNGPHTKGKATDCRVNGQSAYRLLQVAMSLGFTGIGVKVRHGQGFIHIDSLRPRDGWPQRPNVWTY